MASDQMEHIIRTAGAITESHQILVIGGQSILGRFPGAPPSLNISVEADVRPFDARRKRFDQWVNWTDHDFSGNIRLFRSWFAGGSLCVGPRLAHSTGFVAQ